MENNTTTTTTNFSWWTAMETPLSEGNKVDGATTLTGSPITVNSAAATPDVAMDVVDSIFEKEEEEEETEGEKPLPRLTIDEEVDKILGIEKAEEGIKPTIAPVVVSDTDTMSMYF
jgi:hypothetical protein